MDIEQFYEDAVAGAVQKAEQEILFNGGKLEESHLAMVQAAVALGASEVLMRAKKLFNGEEL